MCWEVWTRTHAHTLIPFAFHSVLRHRIGKSWGTAAAMSTRTGCSAHFPSLNLDERLRGKREQHLVGVAVSPGFLKAYFMPEDSAVVFTESSLKVTWQMILYTDFIQDLGSQSISWLLSKFDLWGFFVCPVSISYVKNSFWQNIMFWKEMFCYCILTNRLQLLDFTGCNGKEEIWAQPVKDQKLHLHLF